jgi:diguanylate cyclase (GGDEF)-like protein
MPEIFLIGKNVLKREYKDVLTSKGHKIKSFDSLDTAMPRLKEDPDLLIILQGDYTERSFREFIELSKDIPKIVISDTHRVLRSWIKEPFTHPIWSPGAKEISYFIEKSLKERECLLENKRLRSDTSFLKRELDFCDEVSNALVSCIDLSDTLNIIMKKAKEMTKAEGWSVFLIDNETGELISDMTEDKKTKEVQKFRIGIGEGIAGWVAKEGVPVIVPDVSRDKRFIRRIDRAANLRNKTRSILCVPVKSCGKLIGVIEVFNKTTGEIFTNDDMNQLVKLVDQAAIFIERALLHQKVEDLSITDDLTKLFNQRYLHRTIEMEIQRSLRYQTSVSIIFMDVDYFKQINDNYGHLVGSKVLVEMGQLLIKNLRIVDIVVRYGGDEFVIILPHTSPVAAAQVAERIRKAVERNAFLKEEGYSLKTTASFGVASYPENARSKEELLRLADEAMYKVKYRTRNGVYALV